MDIRSKARGIFKTGIFRLSLLSATQILKTSRNSHLAICTRRLVDTAEALRSSLMSLKCSLFMIQYHSLSPPPASRFGPGPHRVSMRLQLPADTENFPNMPENPTIVIQLNPLDEMPLSVHLFLEQVAHKLWVSFYLYF